MAATPVAVLLNAGDDVKTEIKGESVHLLMAIGSFTVLNYEEGLGIALSKKAQRDA